MSITAPTRPPAARAASGEPDEGWFGSDVRRTLVTALGALLGMTPLRAIFTDWAWIGEVILAVAALLLPAAYLRRRRVPRVYHLLPGLVLLAVVAVTLYLHDSALGGLLPGSGTLGEIRDLHGQAATVVRESSTPLASTRALRMEVVPALALTAGLVDWLAVVRRAPALAGIPLLALFTTCGAIAGSVDWLDFAAAGAGYLVILAADSRDMLMRWGRVVPRPRGDHATRPRLGLSGRRIGVIAVAVAIIVPLLIPGLSRNLLTDALRSGSGSGNGAGHGGGQALSPLASLRGTLDQGDTVPLFSAQVQGVTDPFYLRAKVLETYTDSGWRLGNDNHDAPVTAEALRSPLPSAGRTRSYQARITIDRLRDYGAPFFADPASFNGLDGGWRWSQRTATLGSHRTSAKATYTEQVQEPSPTEAQLQGAVGPVPLELRYLLGLPALPPLVQRLVQTQTARAATPYAKVRALSDFFAAPSFQYSLSTVDGDSGSDLIDFLTNRTGYCQQYAAAMAVMMRVAGVPSRVVVGYTHAAPDAQGRFAVTNRDAHAWVEGWFSGVGWVPFDPTPLAGSDAGRSVALPWAPHGNTTPGPSGTQSTGPAPTTSAGRHPTDTPASSAQGLPVNGGSTAAAVPPWLWPTGSVLVLLVVLIGVAPAIRDQRRRARFRRARQSGRIEPVWQELRATATDAGLAWGTSTTPRQVPGWLAARGLSAPHRLEPVARATERERYAAPSGTPSPEAASVVADAIERVALTGRALQHSLRRPARWRARLWPRSVTGPLLQRLTHPLRRR